MKLLKNQYQDILNKLDEFQLAHERLSLVKKKGRIRIQIEGFSSYFEFFRRKSVSLTDDRQWQKSEHYELSINGKPILVGDWDEVVSHINSWLSALQK